jgi:hypothetical protein
MRDERIKLLRFAAPEPNRTVGLVFRRTSPRKEDFVALGRLVVEASSGSFHCEREISFTARSGLSHCVKRKLLLGSRIDAHPTPAVVARRAQW